MQRGKPPFEGFWSLPGGRIEPGEAAADAIVREVREETGLHTEALGIAGLREVIAPPDAHYVISVFAVTLAGGTLVAGDDAADVAWRGLADLQDAGSSARRQLTPGTAAFILAAARRRDAGANTWYLPLP